MMKRTGKVIDISLSLSEDTVYWPTDPETIFFKHSRIDQGDPANVLHLRMGSHAGTHIDAPYHALKKGQSIDKIDLNNLMGPCYVKEVKGRSVKLEDLENIDFNKYKIILFKTRNSKKRLLFKKKFYSDYVYLSGTAAKKCVQEGVKALGIDYLSIEQYQGSEHVHDTLLSKGIIIIEGLDLRKVKQGEYFIVALPLKIKKGDGAPSRVILIDIK